MSQQKVCDGCGKPEENLKAHGSLSLVDYCPECAKVFEEFDKFRRNLAFESGRNYRNSVQERKKILEKAHPGFKLPDGEISQ